MIIKNAQLDAKISAVLIILFVLLILIIPIKIPFNFYDEGATVFNATRVMDGDIPYKDFWAIYPPGQYYVLAAIFKTFGTSLFVSRVYDTTIRFLLALSVWMVSKKLFSNALSYIIFSTTALLLGSIGFYSYPIFPAIMLSFFSILSLINYIDNGKRIRLLLAGILIGFVSLFRLDIGVYAGISVAGTLGLFHLFREAQVKMHFKRVIIAVSEVSILLGSTLIVVVICYGTVSIFSGFRNLWEQVIIFPTTVFHDLRSAPYPPLLFPYHLLTNLERSSFWSSIFDFMSWIQFYFPIAIYIIAFLNFVFMIVNKRIVSNPIFFGSISVTVLGVLFFAQAISRYDYIHIIPTIIPASIVVVSLLFHHALNYRNNIIKVIFLLLLIGIVLPTGYITLSLGSFSPFQCYSKLERAGCIAIRADQERAVEYIQANTQDNETIFVGNKRHDLIFINDIGFYFLSARQSASRYAELHPGVATSLLVQQEIVRGLKSNHVKWVVLGNAAVSEEPNASTKSTGIYILDNYIHENYALVVEFGYYQILEISTE